MDWTVRIPGFSNFMNRRRSMTTLLEFHWPNFVAVEVYIVPRGFHVYTINTPTCCDCYKENM